MLKIGTLSVPSGNWWVRDPNNQRLSWISEQALCFSLFFTGLYVQRLFTIEYCRPTNFWWQQVLSWRFSGMRVCCKMFPSMKGKTRRVYRFSIYLSDVSFFPFIISACRWTCGEHTDLPLSCSNTHPRNTYNNLAWICCISSILGCDVQGFYF